MRFRWPFVSRRAYDEAVGMVMTHRDELHNARWTMRNAWGAISSGQIVDKDVERHLRDNEQRITTFLKATSE